MDREAWWAIVHRVTKSRTRLKQFSIQARIRYRQKSDGQRSKAGEHGDGCEGGIREEQAPTSVFSRLHQTQLLSPSPPALPLHHPRPFILPLESSSGESNGPRQSPAPTARGDNAGLWGQHCATWWPGPTHRLPPQALPAVDPPHRPAPAPLPARQGEGSVPRHPVYSSILSFGV